MFPLTTFKIIIASKRTTTVENQRSENRRSKNRGVRCIFRPARISKGHNLPPKNVLDPDL